jgi:hypothetical protein
MLSSSCFARKASVSIQSRRDGHSTGEGRKSHTEVQRDFRAYNPVILIVIKVPGVPGERQLYPSTADVFHFSLEKHLALIIGCPLSNSHVLFHACNSHAPELGACLMITGKSLQSIEKCMHLGYIEKNRRDQRGITNFLQHHRKELLLSKAHKVKTNPRLITSIVAQMDKRAVPSAPEAVTTPADAPEGDVA